MPLLNCKVDLKLKWTKHCVLATGSNDNDDANSNNILFLQRRKMSLYSHYQQKTIKNYQNFLAKDL